MASHRILSKLFLLNLLVFVAISSAFAQKKKSDKTAEKPAGKSVEAVQTVSAPVPEDVLLPFRNELSDVYLYYQQRWPNPFDIRPATEDTIPKGDAGFRIQLISTPNKAQADSVFNLIKAWTEANQQDYTLYTYFEFRSPNWRIHVGDFYKRNEANLVAARMLETFSTAWVVNDRIIQERSPYYQRWNRQKSEAGNEPSKQ
jgi:hypothetical protein